MQTTFLIISFVISLVLFGSGFLFVRDTENYFKFAGVICVTSIIIQAIVSHTLYNPSNDTYYHGRLIDKKIEKHLRTRTVSCGEGKTCTETYIEYEYLVLGKINVNGKQEICEITIDTNESGWTPKEYDNAIIGEPFTCAKNFYNYYSLNKDAYKTSENISNKFSFPTKPKIYEHYRFKFIHNYVNLDSKTSSQLESSISNYMNLKPLGLRVVLVNSDLDSYDSLMSKWKGTVLNEVIVFYGLKISENNNPSIVWQKLATYAHNDNNHKLAADFETRLITNPNKSFTLEQVMSDLDFIESNLKFVSEYKYEYLKDTTSQITNLTLLIIFSLIQVAAIIVISRKF